MPVVCAAMAIAYGAWRASGSSTGGAPASTSRVTRAISRAA